MRGGSPASGRGIARASGSSHDVSLCAERKLGTCGAHPWLQHSSGEVDNNAFVFLLEGKASQTGRDLSMEQAGRDAHSATQGHHTGK